jgi:hypothetical protein
VRVRCLDPWIARMPRPNPVVLGHQLQLRLQPRTRGLQRAGGAGPRRLRVRDAQLLRLELPDGALERRRAELLRLRSQWHLQRNAAASGLRGVHGRRHQVHQRVKSLPFRPSRRRMQHRGVAVLLLVSTERRRGGCQRTARPRPAEHQQHVHVPRAHELVLTVYVAGLRNMELTQTATRLGRPLSGNLISGDRSPSACLPFVLSRQTVPGHRGRLLRMSARAQGEDPFLDPAR